MIQGVIALNVGDTSVQAIVGRNISDSAYNVYPIYAPENELERERPFITARIVGVTPTDSRCPSELDQVSVDVVAYASEYETLDRLANASRLSMDGFKGVKNGVDMVSVKFKNQVDTVEETTGLFARIMNYNIAVRRSLIRISEAENGAEFNANEFDNEEFKVA